eukprot:GEMP01001939.1.p1 GENE.GEMP01001939.1~~GEMP01001939.1.p1  ORF type:complete len:1218 (+),score=312.15 GEMP01001939.1:307-3960(+)
MNHILHTVADSIPTTAEVVAQSTPEPSDVLHLPPDPDQHAASLHTSPGTHHRPHATSTPYTTTGLDGDGGGPSNNTVDGTMHNASSDDVERPTGAPGLGGDAANVAALAGARPRAVESFKDKVAAQKSDPREPDEDFLTTAKKVIRDAAGAAKEELGHVAHKVQEGVTRGSHDVVDAVKTKAAQMTGDTSPEPTNAAANLPKERAAQTGFLDVNLPTEASSIKSLTDKTRNEMWDTSTGNSDRDTSMSFTDIMNGKVAQPSQPPSMDNLMNGGGIGSFLGAGSQNASLSMLQKDPAVNAVVSGDPSNIVDGLHQGVGIAVASVDTIPGGAMVKAGINKTVDAVTDVVNNPEQVTKQLEHVAGTAKVVGGMAATAGKTALETTEKVAGAVGENLKEVGENVKEAAASQITHAAQHFNTAMTHAKRDMGELKDEIPGMATKLATNLFTASQAMASKAAVMGSMVGTSSALATTALTKGATDMAKAVSGLHPELPKIDIPIPDAQWVNAKMQLASNTLASGVDKMHHAGSQILGLAAPASIATGIVSSIGLMYLISTILSADGGGAGRIMDSPLDTIAHTGGHHTNRWLSVAHKLRHLGASKNPVNRFLWSTIAGMGARQVAKKRARELVAEAADRIPLVGNAFPDDNDALAMWHPRDFNFQNHWRNDEFVHLNGRWKYVGKAATGESFVYNLEPSRGHAAGGGLFLRSRNLEQRGHGIPSVRMNPDLKADAKEAAGVEEAGAAKGGGERKEAGGGDAANESSVLVPNPMRHFAWQMVEKTNVPAHPIVVPHDWCSKSLNSPNAKGELPEVVNHPALCARAGCRWDPSEMDPWQKCKDVLLQPGLSGDIGPGRCGNTFCGADEYCGHSGYNSVAQCYHLRVPDNRHMRGLEPANAANKLPMDEVDACTTTSCGPDFVCDAETKRCGRAKCDTSTPHMDGMVCLGRDGAPLGEKNSYDDGGGRVFPRAELLQSFPAAAGERDVARARWASPTCVDIHTRHHCGTQFPCYWKEEKTFFGTPDPNAGQCDTDCKLFTGNCELYGCGPATKGHCTTAKSVQMVQVQTPEASKTAESQPSRALWNIIHPQPDSWEQYTKQLNYAWYCAKSNGCAPGCKGPCGLVLDRGAHQYLGIHSMEPFATGVGRSQNGHLASLGLQHDEQWQHSMETILKNEAKQYVAAIEKRVPVTNYLFPQYGFMPNTFSAVPHRDVHALGMDYRHPIAF